MSIKRIRLEWLFYVLAAGTFLGLLVWATRSEIARNPSREAKVELGPYGMVTVQFGTDPYPARATGTVALTFMLMDSRNQPIHPDTVSFEYGRKGNDQPVGSGIFQPMPDGEGMLMANIQMPSVGKWWLRAALGKDGYEADVQFTIDVRPAQE